MKISEFINFALEHKKWSEIQDHITEGDIREIMSEEEDGKFLIINGVPAMAQTAILYLEDRVYYTVLETTIKINEDEYVNAAPIDSLKPFDKQTYLEIKRGLEFVEKEAKSNLNLMYNEEFEKQNDISSLFEPKRIMK